MSTKSRAAMVGNMKGHMALNSSPYKTSVNKLSSQYLIQDQMASHYYNLATIKSAIDSRPPKSTQQSIKKRDQVRRDALLHGRKTPQQKSPRQSNQRQSNEDDTIFQNHDNFASASYSDLYGAHQGQGRTTRSWAPERAAPHTSRSRPATTGHVTSPKQHGGTGEAKTRPKSFKPNVHDVTYSGDYLDRHSDRFRDNGDKAFTPRTKKRAGKSFLSQSKHYCAPPSRSKKKSPREVPANQEQEVMTKGNLREYEIPRLEIERDDDHRRWIEEQSQFVQRLSLLDEQGKLKPTSSLGGKSDTMVRIEREEEELKYLEFINEVTNDILSRGIYSDQVLGQVMERHVQRHRHDLKEDKMRRLLRKLKSDLGMDMEGGSRAMTHYDYNSLPSEKLQHDVDTLKRLQTSDELFHTDADSFSELSYTQTDRRPSEMSYTQTDRRPNELSYTQTDRRPNELSYTQTDRQPSELSYTQTDRRPKSAKPSVLTKLKTVTSDHGSKHEEVKTTNDNAVISNHSKEPSEKALEKVADADVLSPKLDDQELLQKLSDLELKQNQSSDESDYESVAALSTVLKPGAKQRQKAEPEIPKTTGSDVELNPKAVEAEVSHNEDADVAYSDDFNEENDDLTDDEF